MTNIPLEILFQVPSVVGFIWYLSKEHSNIYGEINKHKDALYNDQGRLETRLSLTEQQVNNDIKRIIDTLQQNNKRWGTKFDRLESLLDKAIAINKISEKIDKLNGE
ncbi:MAG: hypothetical protein ACKPJO_11705 [Dolichospermum sp.]